MTPDFDEAHFPGGQAMSDLQYHLIGDDMQAVVINLTPVPREGYRIGV